MMNLFSLGKILPGFVQPVRNVKAKERGKAKRQRNNGEYRKLSNNV